MTFYVLLYNNYCVTVPIIWINFEQSSFKMPATKNLTQSCRKQLSPHDDWNEFKFHKHFDIYLSARSVEQAVAQMSTSDDNIVLQEETKNIAKKRLIKARKFYGDTSNEDEPKKKKIIKFPSNYIPESGKSVSQLSSQPINESSTITNLACGSIKANDEALTNVPTKSVNDINEPEISDEILETNFVDVNSLDSYEDESSCSDTEMQKMTHEKQESRKVVKGNVTARPTIVSQLIILPSTSNDDTNVLNIIQNKENIENNSMTLEHSFCCEKCRKNYLVKFVTIERKLNRIIHFLENENNVTNNGMK
ncbi:uncharacterized protein LOC112639799 isoform X2 [Camponotus floridanus]|uniref:uncharacterized protein LOC112639799 isoform X2 n=1 Tax=Camponotus floridanus TaxID=104421 RepID=UPI000DC687ED|nr:uncharacterized protein LOC112639799 isoform X2 [Camponotus floridanus]